jgi:mannose-6-phosphate isomerase-like protein (cupin superfamily)
MAQRGQTLSHPGADAAIVVRASAAETGGARVDLDVAVAPGSPGERPHVHPEQFELLDVRRGVLRLTVRDRTWNVYPGESAIVPRGAAHSWHALGEWPLEVAVSYQPAGRAEAHLEGTASAAADGLLARAALLHASRGFRYAPRIPIRLQKVAYALLAPAAWVASRRRRSSGFSPAHA